MTELLTAAQMRAIEEAAIAAGDVTGLELMEHAGRGVVDAMLEWRPELARAPQRAVVLCGPGNNGGDGLVVARLLKERGWEVQVFLYGRDPAEIDRLPPDAAENARRWRELGAIRPLSVDEFIGVARQWGRGPDVCVDALFGSGRRALEPSLSETLWAISGRAGGEVSRFRPRRTVAVDCPSGLDMDSGKFLVADPDHAPGTLTADLTVTFHRARRGHHLDNGPNWCRALRVVDIGLKGPLHRVCGFITTSYDDDAETVALLDRKMALAAPTRSSIGKAGSLHKYDFGHALILSGGVGKGGAARMAARGSLRIGAGLVTVGCPPAALQENASALDAVMLRAFGEAGALAAFVPERKVKAVCMGPGFGHGERLRAFLRAVLQPGGHRSDDANDDGDDPSWFNARGMGDEGRPALVLDADALSEYRDHPETLFAMLHPACVLTPHQGEFGRLFPDLLEKLEAPAATGPAYSKVDATREAAARAGCVVLFKGPDSVTADPSGRCAISSAAYERAAPWLATAGTGDVLAGFVTGLLARGFSAFDAAQTAAWLHVECALHFGPGLIAEDLPEQLPAVFRKLGL